MGSTPSIGTTHMCSLLAIACRRSIRGRVVWRSDHYFAVWQDPRNTSSIYDIYGARVMSGGVVTDPNGFAISTSPNSQTAAAVAYDNSTGGTSSALVVFQSNSVATNRVRGVIVGP